MGKPVRILFVEDVENDVELTLLELQRGGYEVDHQRVETAEDMTAALANQKWDLIVCDYHMPRFNAFGALEVLKKSGLDLPSILVSGTVGEDIAVAAMKAGAHDYFIKSNLKRLPAAVDRELKEAKLRQKRRRAEEALRASQERFKKAFTNAALGVAIADLDGGLLEINPYYCDLVGYSEKELLTMQWFELVHPDDRSRRIDQVNESLKSKIPFTWSEHRYVRKDGQIIWVLVSSSILTGPKGEPQNTVALIQDITSRKAAEEALANESKFSTAILDTVGVLIAVLDTQGRIIKINSAGRKMLGYSPEEVLERFFIELVPPEDRADILASISELISSRCPRTSERVFMTKDGGRRLLAVTSTVLVDHEGLVEYIIVTGLDITERREMEAQLLQAQKLESLGQLAAGVAHEINTPMQYVGSNTEFLGQALNDLLAMTSEMENIIRSPSEDHSAEDIGLRLKQVFSKKDLSFIRNEIPKAVEETMEGVERITSIVRSLNQFAHPGQGQKTLINIHKAIENTISISRNEWKYVAKVVTDFDSDLPEIFCLSGDFNQVILNLIVNAAHAIADVGGHNGPDLGTITIATRKANDWAEIRIGDTGTGIPEKIRAKIYDPFFTTKEPGKGTGQGLSIVHAAIVKRHGGNISFETEEGRGTTFIIRLPLIQAG